MDIVERLRQEIAGYTDGPIEAAEATMHEAADEIELLRNKVRWLDMCENTVVKRDVKIERLRKALRMWVKFWEEDGDDVWLAEEAMEATYSLLRDDNV